METRKLEFTEAEVQSALVTYSLRREIDLPERNIEQVIIGEGTNPTVILEYVPGQPGDESDVEFSGEQVAAALILYCKSQKIPLPRQAKKVLLEEDGGISMIIRIQWKE